MTLGNIAEAKQVGTKINAKFFAIVTCPSLATGLLSGGVQHYLDNPIYAGYLLATGAIVTYVFFFLKDAITLRPRDIVVVGAVAAGLLLASYGVSSEISGDGHTDHTH